MGKRGIFNGSIGGGKNPLPLAPLIPTVDGCEIRLSPVENGGLYIPLFIGFQPIQGGAEFLPSTV